MTHTTKEPVVLDISRIVDAASTTLSLNATLLVFGIPIALTGLGELGSVDAGWWAWCLVLVPTIAFVLFLLDDYGKTYWRGWLALVFLVLGSIIALLVQALLEGEFLDLIAVLLLGGGLAVFAIPSAAGCAELLGVAITELGAGLTEIMDSTTRVFRVERRWASGPWAIAGRTVHAAGIACVAAFPAALLISSLTELGVLSGLENLVTAGSLMFFALPLGGMLIYFGRRLMQRRARSDVENMTRLPVVLLRSFDDDGRQIARKAGPVSFLFFGYKNKIRLEEAISQELWGIGPFFAVGQPGETLPRLGAARASFADDAWQGAVLRWIEHARLIVMIAGRSKWVAWELEQVVRLDLTKKLLILFPPGDVEPSAIRWQTLVRSFRGTRWESTAAAITAQLQGVVAVYFDDEGSATLIKADGQLQESHEIAIRLAAYGILLRQERPAP